MSFLSLVRWTWPWSKSVSLLMYSSFGLTGSFSHLHCLNSHIVFLSCRLMDLNVTTDEAKIILTSLRTIIRTNILPSVPGTHQCTFICWAGQMMDIKQCLFVLFPWLYDSITAVNDIIYWLCATEGSVQRTQTVSVVQERWHFEDNNNNTRWFVVPPWSLALSSIQC